MKKATDKQTTSGDGGSGGRFSSTPPKTKSKRTWTVGIGIFVVFVFIMLAFVL